MATEFTSFRACYFVAADGQSDVRLTSEEDSDKTDAELIELAVAEAKTTGLIGDEEHFQVTEGELRDGLRITEYRMGA